MSKNSRLPLKILGVRCDLWVVMVYFGLEACWLHGFDWVVNSVPWLRGMSSCDLYRRWFYVLVSSLFLYFILWWVFQRVMRVQHDLADREEQYRMIFETNADALFVLDQRTGAILDANTQAIALYGYTLAEFKTLKITDLSGKMGQTRAANETEQTQEPFREHRKKDGTLFPVEITANDYTRGDQRLAIVNIHDLSERHAVLKTLEDSKRSFEQLTDKAPIPLGIHSLDGEILYLNDQFVEVFGYGIEDIPSLDVWWEKAYPNPAYRSYVQQTWAALNDDAKREGEPLPASSFQVTCKDGSVRDVEFQGATIGERVLILLNDVTLEKRAATQLKQVTDRLEMATHAGKVGVWDLNVLSQELIWDDMMLELYGLTRQEFCGTYEVWRKAVHPKDLEAAEAVYRSAIRGDEEYDTEFRVTRPDGVVRMIHAQGVVQFDDSGVAVRMLGVNWDVTVDRKMEADLRAGEERYRMLFETSNDGIMIMDGSQFLTCNQRCCEMLGAASPDELVGKTPLDISPEMQPDGLCSSDLVRGHMHMVQNGDAPRFKWQLLKADRSLVDVEVSLKGLPIGEGTFTQVILRDMTEQVRAEKEKNRLYAAIEQAAEVVIVTDVEGEIVYVNPAACSVTGYEQDELLGANPRVLSSGKHGRGFYKKIWNTLLAGRVWTGQLINKRKDGQLYTEEVAISPVKDAGGHIINFVAVKRDITNELLLEEQYRQSQKMEAVGQLAGGIAHDFNNILQSILGFTEILRGDFEEPSQHYSDLTEIQHAARRAADLTRQLLTFSRKQTAAFSVVDLNEILESEEKMLSRILGEDIQVEVRRSPDLWRVHADANQLQQVVMNLCLNARDAMAQGGRLQVQSENMELTASDVALNTQAREGAFVRLLVKDSGMGMSEDVLDHLFEPFFTTKAVGKGTGLGLSVVYGIVKHHGGWIDARSKLGQGSVFEVYLPMYAGEEQDASTVNELDAREVAFSGHGESILIVEDEQVVRELAYRVLTDAGYHTVAVESGTLALKAFSERGRPFDLIFSDIILPDMNGLEVADLIREDEPKMGVILCSGHTGERVGIGDIRARGYCFLQKPFSVSLLLKMVRKVLDERRRWG